MKNILFVDHHAELGGGEIALLEIIKNLDRDKFSLFAMLGDDGPFKDELVKSNVDVVVDKLPDCFRQLDRDPERKNRPLALIKSVFFLSRAGKKLKALIKEKNINIVYINSIKSLLYSVKAAKSTNCRIIWHLHDCLSSDFYPQWTLPFIISNSKMADCVICVSGLVRDYFIKAGGNKDKALIIYNGVDTKRFKPDVSGEFIKKEFNISGKRTVSLIGRLEPWKGQGVFIEAAKIICNNRDDIVFLIAGAPLFGFNEYEKELKIIVEQSGIKDKIFLLGFRNDIEKIYAASDIIAHCSNRPEPFGRDVIEAMACSRPIISSNIGAPSEIIADRKDGILIKPNDPNILACEILKLMDDAQLLQELSRNARAKAERSFDITKIAQEVEQLL